MINKGLIVLGGAMLLVGCGGSGTTVKTGVGYYEDSAVSGVSYVCGSKSGLTSEDGSFTFEKGKSCIFSINNIKLREVAASELSDGVKVKESDLKVAQFLQSLDNDGNASNNIQITQDVLDALKDITSIPTDYTDVESLLGAVGSYKGRVKSKSEALFHLAGFSPKIVTQNDTYSTDETVVFDVNITGNKKGLSYVWREGNTILSQNKSFSKSNFVLGEHIIKLSVTNSENIKINDSKKITINTIRDMNVTISTSNYGFSLDTQDMTFVSNITYPGEDINYTWIDTFTSANATTPTLGNITPDNHGVPIQVNDKNTTFDEHTSTITKKLAEGRHEISLVVEDKYGNISSSKPIGIWINFEPAAPDGDYILKDRIKNLTWINSDSEACHAIHSQDALDGTGEYQGEGADDFCTNLDFAGYQDWRVPTINEIKDFVSRTYVGNIRPDTASGNPCPYMLGKNGNDFQIVTSRHLRSNIPGTIKEVNFPMSIGLRCVRNEQ